eukprot:NODE_55_length_26219_cov_0.194908.p17 type:complete len:139 gc:universal NODE_55_length_26219_cov_0.194908:16173-15757(-)
MWSFVLFKSWLRETLEMTEFEEIVTKSLSHPVYDVSNVQVSIEGFIILITNIHEEATEDDLLDLVSEYGKVVHIHLNTDRRTGYVKGYCMLEYSKLDEAIKAIQSLHNRDFMNHSLACDFAFVRPNSRKIDRVLTLKS